MYADDLLSMSSSVLDLQTKMLDNEKGSVLGINFNYKNRIVLL